MKGSPSFVSTNKPWNQQSVLIFSIIIGGEDLEIDDLDGEVANMGDRHPLALQQYHQLLRRVRRMFPQIELFNVGRI